MKKFLLHQFCPVKTMGQLVTDRARLVALLWAVLVWSILF